MKLLKALEEHDLISEFNDSEVDIYTAGLLSWLSSSVENVYYLTEALEEFGLKDGFEALKMAQYLAIREITDKLINNIENF